MADDILKMIDDAVEKKTFNLDALEAIKQIKDKAALLQARVDQLDGECQRRLEHQTKLDNLIIKLNTEIDLMKSRETLIETREKKMTELEKERAVSLAVQSAYEKMFDKVFANRQFRESVIENGQHSFPPSGMASYPTTAPVNTNRTTTTEEL